MSIEELVEHMSAELFVADFSAKNKSEALTRLTEAVVAGSDVNDHELVLNMLKNREQLVDKLLERNEIPGEDLKAVRSYHQGSYRGPTAYHDDTMGVCLGADVLDSAEVSVATVYNYFGSKTALLLAGVDEVETAPLPDEPPGLDPRSWTILDTVIEHF